MFKTMVTICCSCNVILSVQFCDSEWKGDRLSTYHPFFLGVDQLCRLTAIENAYTYKLFYCKMCVDCCISVHKNAVRCRSPLNFILCSVGLMGLHFSWEINRFGPWTYTVLWDWLISIQIKPLWRCSSGWRMAVCRAGSYSTCCSIVLAKGISASWQKDEGNIFFPSQ